MAIVRSVAQRLTAPRSWVRTAVCEQGLYDRHIASDGSGAQRDAVVSRRVVREEGVHGCHVASSRAAHVPGCHFTCPAHRTDVLATRALQRSGISAEVYAAAPTSISTGQCGHDRGLNQVEHRPPVARSDAAASVGTVRRIGELLSSYRRQSNQARPGRAPRQCSRVHPRQSPGRCPRTHDTQPF
jgi:hypothetical protein